MQEGLTIAEVVAGLVSNVTTLSAITAPAVFGVIEFAKKFGLPSKYAGLLSAPIGVLVVFLIQGATFTPIGILTGILVGFATSGVYSQAKAIATK